MKRETPRQELNRLLSLNSTDGCYGVHNQFVVLIENRLSQQATKIMNSLNSGFLWTNERLVYNTIYDYLLDGVSVKNIKLSLKTL